MNETYSDIDSVIQLSKDANTLGFDLRAGQTWVYPTNLPVRDYQYNITQAALTKNTLVSLPTGLGKTFIAAVVMYNFYRWYPMGKVIFMAPTKPLVAQQIDACYNIMAIPPSVTAEMTGSKVNTLRAQIWKEKRVFFITPHILQNDIDFVLDLAPQIRCIVIDEAHKALGKNANCEAIRKIQNLNTNFRILALSATPGNNFNSIKDVITNLMISHIEVRTNESIDVAPFVFQRRLETIVIPINGKLLAVRDEFIKILDTYTRPLLQNNIITGNCANITKGRMVLTMKEFKEKGRNNKNYGFILRNLNICVTLYHGYELLIRHGLRGFLSFFEGNISKPLINSIKDLHGIIESVSNYLGPVQEVEMLPDGTIPEVKGEVIFSHPKFHKLSQILLAHFTKVKDADTRVMVFCEYRESVMEIYSMLLRHRPVVRPRIFLGQGAISQAQQMQAVKMFKSGTCNTLVSTCIGEEGLDVGEVDLIVCFDISSKSPIRMVQRMGRTGRKRDGHVIVLVTEGKEEQLLSECMVQKNNMNCLLESQQIKQFLYTNNPRMIPENIKPECNKMFITVQAQENTKKKKERKSGTRKNSLKNMLENISSSQTSKSSEDSKNVKSTGKAKKTTKSPKKGWLSSPGKKQGDLRAMFSKMSCSQMSPNSKDVFVERTSTTREVEDPELNKLLAGVRSYLNASRHTTNGCRICENLFDCKSFCCSSQNEPSLEWRKPDFSIFDQITSDSLQLFYETLTPVYKNTFNRTFESSSTKIYDKNELEKSLEFFKLETLSDIFSDGSSSPEMNHFAENPILFNQSLDIIDSSLVQTPKSVTLITPVSKKLNKTEELFEDDIVFSDEEKSPILCTSDRILGYKHKVQRRLFSQLSSTPNSNVSKDINPLQSTSNFDTASNSCHSYSTKTNNENISSIKNYFNTEQVTNKTQNNTTNSVPNKSFIYNKNKSIESKSCFSYSAKTNNDNIKSIKNYFNTGEVTNKSQNSTVNSVSNKSFIHDKNESIENKSKPKTNETTSKNSKLQETEEDNFQFWDESLFETSDIELISDDSCDIKQETDQLVENSDQINNANSDNTVPNNSVILDNLNISNNTHQETNKDLKKEEYDSDETIILSFNTDDLLDNIENENLNNQEKNEQPNVSNLISKSICNKTTDLSLLSVTQMIDFLNDSKNLNKSLKPKENQNVVIKTQSVMKDSSLPKTISNVIQENKTCHVDVGNENVSPNNVLNTIKPVPIKDKNVSENKPNIDVTDILKDINFDDSEEEQSLLSFSQNKLNRHKKLKLSLTRNKQDKSQAVNNKSISISQDSPLKLPSKNPKQVVVLSDSDDDFETRPSRSKPVCKITPEKRFQRIKSVPASTKSSTSNSSQTVKCTVSSTPKVRSNSYPTTNNNKKMKAKKKIKCGFIDDEAEIEDDEHYVTDSAEDSGSDILESSFVNDTQSVLDQTDMHAVYLQSVISPKFKQRGFKMPIRPPPKVYDNIFSQVENNEDDTYMDDSFCVGNDVTLSQRNGMSYLEMVEAELEKKSKAKKRKRIICRGSDDSE